MKTVTLLLLITLLPSCAVHPFISDGKNIVASLGSSLLSKTDNEGAYYRGPLGEIGYGMTKKDETVVPGQITRLKEVEAISEQVGRIWRGNQVMRQSLSRDSVKRAGIKSAERIDALKITTIPPEVPVVPATLPAAVP